MTAQEQATKTAGASGKETGHPPIGGYLPHAIAAFGPGTRPDDRSLALQAGAYRLILALARLSSLRPAPRPTAPRSIAARLQGS